MVDNTKNIPQYRQLYELLRKHIITGVYQEGDTLPSENELCKIHYLTRPTVRQALDALVHEGYILKHQGKGSIVHKLSKEIGILSIHGTTSVIGDQYLQTKIIVNPEVRPWDDPFIFALSEEEKESGCIYMERLRTVKERPIFYDTNYLPNINLSRFCSRNIENKSLFDILRRHYQVEIKGGQQRLRAISCSKKLSKYLKIKPNHPVLHLERKISTNRPGFYIYSSLYCNTEEYSLFGVF